jgi:DNA-binding MarR family transcriptional regulator
VPDTSAEDPIPALLRGARGAYGNAMTARLVEAGFDDLPRNGPFVLGGMADRGGSAADVIRGLGVSRQAASQLIDTMVLRGYLTREVNSDDRRRMDIALTDRGTAAARVIRSTIEQVDAELADMLTADQLAGLRAGLMALCAIRGRLRGDRHLSEL